MEEQKNELILKNVKVIFTELEDKGFGTNITIDASSKDVQDKINAWAKENGLTFKIKDYTDKEGKTTQQASFKLSKFVQIEGFEEWQSLGYGAVINLIVRAYEYDNKFGKGMTSSIAGIRVIEERKNNVMDKI